MCPVINLGRGQHPGAARHKRAPDCPLHRPAALRRRVRFFCAGLDGAAISSWRASGFRIEVGMRSFGRANVNEPTHARASVLFSQPQKTRPSACERQHGAIQVTLSRKGAKRRTRRRTARSTGTKARLRCDRMPKSGAALEQLLKSCRRELAEAQKQQTATSEVLRVISSSPGTARTGI